MSKREVAIGEQFLRILNKAQEAMRTPRDYGTGELLHSAEIHMVMLVGSNPGAGVTDLAKAGGLTKGAVSQMLEKIEHKGLITRSPDPEDSRRVAIDLTTKGKIAYYAHIQFHEDSDRELYEYVEKLKPEQLDVIEQFLSLIERGIDKRSET